MAKFKIYLTLAILFAMTKVTYASITSVSGALSNSVSNVDTIKITANSSFGSVDLSGKTNLKLIICFDTLSPSGTNADLHLPNGCKIQFWGNGALVNLSGNNSNHRIRDNTCFWGKHCCSGNSTIPAPAEISASNACGYCPLPIHLLSFTGKMSSEFVANLQWSTASEQNNDHFEILFSGDGKSFVKVGEVNSSAVNGNSISILNYEFTHVIPIETRIAGKPIFYKIAQVDFNGTKTESEVFATKNQIAFSLPLNIRQLADGLYVQIGEDYDQGGTINVYDMNGRNVKSITVNQSGWVQIPIEELPMGLFFIQANLKSEFTTDYTETKKIVMQ